MAQSALTKAAKNVQVKTATVTEAIGTTQTTVFVLPKDAFILYFTVTGPDEATQTIDIGTTADDDFYVAAGTLAPKSPLKSVGCVAKVPGFSQTFTIGITPTIGIGAG